MHSARAQELVDDRLAPRGDVDDGEKSATLRAALADARSIRGFHERHWTQADLSLWAVSDLNDQELHEFAQAFESSNQ